MGEYCSIMPGPMLHPGGRALLSEAQWSAPSTPATPSAADGRRARARTTPAGAGGRRAGAVQRSSACLVHAHLRGPRGRRSRHLRRKGNCTATTTFHFQNPGYGSYEDFLDTLASAAQAVEKERKAALENDIHHRVADRQRPERKRSGTSSTSSTRQPAGQVGDGRI